VPEHKPRTLQRAQPLRQHPRGDAVYRLAQTPLIEKRPIQVNNWNGDFATAIARRALTFPAKPGWCPRLAACPGGKVGLMADPTNPESFEEIVEWAYSTLPQKIRDLPDFPGIQVVDEPPADVLQDISNREKWRRGTELLGLYSGILRTKRSHTQVKYAPDLIFVFRGPILRCLKGDLRAEVKRVVWHEVAHWLGYETEEQVKALGL
jgi:predicted Zn-dependent protease with MMP-like domain